MENHGFGVVAPLVTIYSKYEFMASLVNGVASGMVKDLAKKLSCLVYPVRLRDV